MVILRVKLKVINHDHLTTIIILIAVFSVTFRRSVSAILCVGIINISDIDIIIIIF